MTEIIKVSKLGNNVLTTTDPNQLVFSSDYNTLKYYSSGTVQVGANGADQETSVTHNLGYVPYFIVYVNYFAFADTNNYNMCPGLINDIGQYVYAQSYADTTKIYMKIYTNSSHNTYIFRYFIFRNNLGL